MFPITLSGQESPDRGTKFLQMGPGGHVTSGTMVPYWVFSERGILSEPTDEKRMRSIALAYINSDLKEGQKIEVSYRGKKLEGVIVERHLSGEAPLTPIRF